MRSRFGPTRLPLPSPGSSSICRAYAALSSTSSIHTGIPPSPASPFEIFHRPSVHARRTRAALNPSLSRLTDYVKDEIAERMIDRLLDVRKRYPEIVELGSGAGYIAKAVDKEMTQKVVMTDSCEAMLRRDENNEHLDVDVERRVMDEELLTFEEDSQACIMSSLALHWVNDLPGSLIQIRRSLKPDGVFIGAMFGGDTLFELRTAMQLAEQEREGGVSPRVSPMTDSRSMSSLLHRAGFAIPTVDVDEVQIRYPSMWELVDDLRAMGESNAVNNRRPFIRRDTLIAAASIYSALHGDPEGGSVPATFSIVYCIGWKPDTSQPKPLQRGSAKKSMKEMGESSKL